MKPPKIERGRWFRFISFPMRERKRKKERKTERGDSSYPPKVFSVGVLGHLILGVDLSDQRSETGAPRDVVAGPHAQNVRQCLRRLEGQVPGQRRFGSVHHHIGRNGRRVHHGIRHDINGQLLEILFRQFRQIPRTFLHSLH